MKRCLMTAAVTLVVWCAAWPQSAGAATIALNLESNNAGLCSPLGPFSSVNGGHQAVIRTSSNNVAAGISAGGSCLTVYGTVVAVSAQGSFGSSLSLGASTSISVPATPGDKFSDAFAGARFSDVVTLTGGATGTPGALQLSFLMDGTTGLCDRLGCGGALLAASLQSLSNPSIRGGAATPGVPFAGAAPSGVVVLTIPFLFGVQATLDVDLQTMAFLGDNGPYHDVASDYLHTAALTSVAVLDQSGRAIVDGGVTSASGLSYGAVASVPEPSTVLLTATGVALLWRGRRRMVK